MKKNFEVFCLVLGTVLGAGFMTGKEIVIFFAQYGYYSILFLPVLFLLFFYLFKKMLTSNFEKIEKRMKRPVIAISLFALNLVLASSMFSAVKSILFSFLPSAVAVIIMVCIILLCVLVCLGGIRKLISINKYVVPFMLVSLLVLLGIGFFIGDKINFLFNSKLYNIPIVSFLYAMFNLAVSAVVISKAGNGIDQKRAGRISLVSSVVLILLILAGIIVINLNASNIMAAEMPFMELSESVGIFMQVFMFITIVFACVTTLFAVLVTLFDTVAIKVKNRYVNTGFCVVVTLLLSFIGFGNIIGYFYPVAGVIGTYLIISLFLEREGSVKRRFGFPKRGAR